jgi:hypothetical protein
MRWVIAWVMAVLFLASCANFYQYKYVKNTSSKKKVAFYRDKKNCDVISKKRSGVFNNLTYSGNVPQDKVTGHYEKCMYRKGWRKK